MAMSEGDRPPEGRGILHPEGMRAARDLAAGVAHEVNNVLGVIIGNAHLAKKNLANPASLERYLGELRDAAEEGRELMRHLAILAGGHPIRPRTLSLNDLVKHSLSGVEKPTELDLSAEDPAVELDVWLAQDALGSLARFMAATNSVSSLRVVTRVVGGAVALTLEDDGSSLDDGELGKLFAPFSKADRRPKTGVDLTKVVDLASRFGGRVAAGTREPNGLRVIVTLPVATGVPSGDGPGMSLPKKGV
jgi:signal transduction histidine kinase